MMTEAILNAYAQRLHDMTLIRGIWSGTPKGRSGGARICAIPVSIRLFQITKLQMRSTVCRLAILRWNRHGLNPICGATAHRHVLMSFRAPII